MVRKIPQNWGCTAGGSTQPLWIAKTMRITPQSYYPHIKSSEESNRFDRSQAVYARGFVGQYRLMFCRVVTLQLAKFDMVKVAETRPAEGVCIYGTEKHRDEHDRICCLMQLATGNQDSLP